MNPNQFIQHQNTLITHAHQELKESNQLIESFANHWKKTTEHPLEELETLQSLKLILQYRLDTQNSLSQLNHLQQYLRQLLGVEPQHSFETNIERLAFALGTEELHQLLNMLNHLVESILRILAHQSNQKALERHQALERLKNNQQIVWLAKAIDKQNQFTSLIKQIKLGLGNLATDPHPGVIYDHIAALEGPISRFYQALQHGLILSYSVYQQLEQKNQAKYQLADTVQSANQLAQQLHYSPESFRLFTPTPGRTPSERLEERAAAKRLGHFFNH